MASLVIKDVQIKTTVRHHFISIRITKIKRQTMTNIDEDVEKMEPVDTAGGKVT